MAPRCIKCQGTHTETGGACVVDLARACEYGYRPDPSRREGMSSGNLLFSERCACNAIESVARALAGVS